MTPNFSREIARYVERGESVFLVAPADLGRTLVEGTALARAPDAPAFAIVDLEDHATETRTGLLRSMAMALGFSETAVDPSRDLRDFSDLLKQRGRSGIALAHFERTAGRYGRDFYSALGYLVAEARALRLLLQADRAICEIDLAAADRLIFLKTVESS